MNSCAFYSTKGTIPSHINSIYIQPILNKSSDQEITDILDQSLNNILISENILEIINYENADSKMEVTILEVIDIPYTISNENHLGMATLEIVMHEVDIVVFEAFIPMIQIVETDTVTIQWTIIKK